MGEKRASHIARQINEGMMGVRDEDYDELGQIDMMKLERRQKS